MGIAAEPSLWSHFSPRRNRIKQRTPTQPLSGDTPNTMMMISNETLEVYSGRASNLKRLFLENITKAMDLVIKDSPVDYKIHNLVCVSYTYMIETLMLQHSFLIEGIKRITGNSNEADAREDIEDFHKLEKALATQNKLLEKIASAR